MRAQVNFEDYNNVVTNSLGDTMVNGSTQVSIKPFRYFSPIRVQDLAVASPSCADAWHMILILFNISKQVYFIRLLYDHSKRCIVSKKNTYM